MQNSASAALKITTIVPIAEVASIAFEQKEAVTAVRYKYSSIVAEVVAI